MTVPISGTNAIVAAHADDDNGTDSGSAYLFDTTTGRQVAKLLPNDGAAFDRFGISVAISGTTAIVGAYYDDDNGARSGSAYLFELICSPASSVSRNGSGSNASILTVVTNPVLGTNWETDLDYQEIYGSLSFSDATVGVAYSDDYYFETVEFYYLYGDYGFEFSEGFSLGLHYGYNSFEDKDTFLSSGDAYSDWSVTVSKEFGGVEFSLGYVDTDLDEEECFDEDWCDASVVFSIAKSL